MTFNDQQKASVSMLPEGDAELAKLGITRKSVDYFHVGKYRYTDLKDAVAQAKREGKSL